MSSAFLLGEVPFFHDRVSAIAFSPTQPLLASVGGDGALRLFDCDTGRERLAFSLGSSWADAMDVCFSPDGVELFVATWHGHSVRRWSCADWRELPPIALDQPATSVAVSADGGSLVIGVTADNFPESVVGVLVCERSGTVRRRLSLDQMGSGLVAVAVNADATRLAALAVDGHWDESQQLKIWELPSERVLHEEFEATYQSDAWLSVDPTGSWLVTKTRGTVLFDFRDGQVVGKLDDSIDRAVFLPDGRLATCRFDELVVSEADGSHPRSALLALGSGDSGLAAAQWGPVLAVARGSAVALLSTDTLARRFPEALCTKTVALAFSGDGTQLYVVGEGERVIHLFDVRTRACLSRISFPDAWPIGVVFPVGLGPERSVCLHGAYARRDTATALDDSSTDLGEMVDLGQVTFSTDARYALAPVGRDPMLINLESGRRESIALPGRRERGRVALGSGAKRIAFETEDGLVVRDASSPWILAKLPSHPDLAFLAFSPDGTRLAVARNGQELEVWDVAAKRIERTVPVPPGYPTAAAFSADNARIAIGSTTGVVTVEELRPRARE